MLIDTHCHLTVPQFEHDLEGVLERARQAGVEAMVTIGIDLAHSRAAVALAEQHPQVYATVGVHPNDADTLGEKTLAELRDLAGYAKAVGIGEIGLDYYWRQTPADLQKTVFRQQLDLAAELGLPVIIHDREAHDDLRTELRAWVRDRLPGSALALRPFPGVLHSFSGDVAMAEEAYDWGFVLGLAGPVTFKNARGLHDLARRLRPDRLLIETDAPYLTPHPHRGQRNEPAFVRLTAAKLSELWGMPIEQVGALTTKTARAFFGLDGVTGAA